MPKLTLLDVVQRTLSSIDSDEVNSISDTIEATQMAYLARDVLNEIVEELDLGFKGELMKLEDAVDADHPTRLRMPDSYHQIQFINYQKPVNATTP